MDDNLKFRDADPSEDDELARIMYNAFLPIWNHNWFQCLTAPLDSIPSTDSPLTPLQKRRLAFYRSWITFVRAHSGSVTLAYTPSAASSDPSSGAQDHQLLSALPPNSIAAMNLLLPPNARPSWLELPTALRTGLLPGVAGLGPRGMYRVLGTFEGNVERMIGQGLKARKVAGGDQKKLLFCQGCVRNPQWVGKAPARRLFDWAIRRWWAREIEAGKPPSPVWLDTTIDEGIRAYEAIGFEILGECTVDTGADEHGIKLKAGASEEVKEKARKRSIQWVMLRMPPKELTAASTG